MTEVLGWRGVLRFIALRNYSLGTFSEVLKKLSGLGATPPLAGTLVTRPRVRLTLNLPLQVTLQPPYGPIRPTQTARVGCHIAVAGRAEPSRPGRDPAGRGHGDECASPGLHRAGVRPLGRRALSWRVSRA